jgi:GNAT superfamily N-acetyltransferase
MTMIEDDATPFGRDGIDLPGGPAIAGLRLRTYAGPGDLPALLGLYRAVDAADGVTFVTTSHELRLAHEHSTDLDPREHELLVFVHDELVATSSVEVLDSNDGRTFLISRGRVHPVWRRHGIGEALFSLAERRLVTLAAARSDPRPRVLVTRIEEGDVGARVLAEHHGYDLVRLYQHLVRADLEDILESPLPDGLEVRPLTTEQLPALWDAMTDAFKEDFGADDTSPASYRRFVEDEDLDLSLASIAWEGDEIAGGVIGYVVPEENEAQGYLRGWADPVFTRQPWRRRGLASSLLGRTLTLLRDRGMTSAQLGVDTENAFKAYSLYERHGFRPASSTSEWHRPIEAAKG